jgi:hypothetical protein
MKPQSIRSSTFHSTLSSLHTEFGIPHSAFRNQVTQAAPSHRTVGSGNGVLFRGWESRE